ncbi:MAG: sigma-54-dependent Fis family transcriptional regulator [Acidobacteria bacterium]|nr:sigma-54-dependent Fis family transcriptional regulator [Acidobacteriota bacterium]
MKRNERILIADDDADLCRILDYALKEWGFETEWALDGMEAVTKAERFRPAIIISDVRMPKMNGMELVRAVKQTFPHCAVILITGHADVKLAVEAIKLGATDYISKPVEPQRLRELIDFTLEKMAPYARAADLDEQLKKRGIFGRLVGQTSVMREVYGLIKSVSPSSAPVMITGESGTGKELAARTIHDLSPRKERAFIAINSSAIPETLIESEVFGHEKGAFTGALDTRIGCFEMANKGTLFFDEIAEMPIVLQPKLLRVVEDGRVRRLGGKQEFAFDARIMAATNRDPIDALKKGSMREDLFYRFNVFSIKMPPLRERKEDVPFLVQHFINDLSQKYGLPTKSIHRQTEDILTGYAWPGNVRELRNVIERAMIVCKNEVIMPAHLPPYYRETQRRVDEYLKIPLGRPLREIEEQVISRTLEMTGQNKAETARILGVDVKTIRNKLRSHELADEDKDEG